MTASPQSQDPDGIRHVEDPAALIHGHRVKLQHNGSEAFPAWLAAIEAARSRISLEMYIFADDGIGRRFAEALARAAQRGVEVRVLYDFVGCRATPAGFFQRMRGFGVHVVAYHKYRFWRPRFWSLIRRNHRKALICDGRVAFTGGLNISDEWVGVEEGGAGWRDAAIQIEGPAVAELEASFLRIWNRRASKRTRLSPARLAPVPAAGPVPLVLITNGLRRNRFAIRRAAVYAIRASRLRLDLANPYFVPDRGVLRALIEAAQRGVAVRLFVPEASDSRLLDFAARAVFEPLLTGGVRIFRSRSVVHTKALAVDGVFTSIGSYNFDHRSLAYNLELVVNVIDPGTAANFDRLVLAEMAGFRELTREAFAQRAWIGRLFERLAYALRKLL